MEKFISYHKSSLMRSFSIQCGVQYITWFAIIAGYILPISPSSGHLGQRSLCQKLNIDSSSCCLIAFSLVDLQMELMTEGHSKVLEQLGHDKINGSQLPYLQFR